MAAPGTSSKKRTTPSKNLALFEQLRLLEFLQDAVIVFEPDDLRVLEVNARACDLYGFTREAFIGLPLLQIALDAIEDRARLDELLTGEPGRIVHYETTQIRSDHTPVVVHVQAQLIEFRGQKAVLSVNRDITELRRAERELAMSEERFGRIFHASPAATALITPSGWMVDANQSFCQLVGHPRDRVVNKNLYDLNIFQDDFAAIIQTLFERHHLSNHETRIRSQNDRVHFTVSSYEWIEIGGELCILAQFFDLTDRKQAEDELRRSETQYRDLLGASEKRSRELTLINHIRGVILRETDSDAVVRAVIEGIRTLYGYSHISIYFLRNGLLHLQHQVGYDQVISVIPLTGSVSGRAIRTGKPILIEDVSSDEEFLAAVDGLQSEACIPLMLDGEPVGTLNVETSNGLVLTQEDFEILQALGDHVVIALQRARLYDAEKEQRLRAETLAQTNAELYDEQRRYASELELRVIERTAQMQRAKEQVEAILNASSDLIVLIDIDGHIHQANPAFVQHFSLVEAPASGESLLGFLDSASHEAMLSALRRTFDREGMQRLEVNTLRADGLIFPAEAVIDFVGTRGWGEPVAVCTIRDITQRRRLELELREALDKERALVELKSRFGAMASHEFRTPLAVIRTSTELLMNHSERMTPARRVEGYQSIIAQVQHLTSLIDDLLAISRADTIGSDFNPAPTDLLTYCGSLTREIQWLASQTHTLHYSHSGPFRPVLIDRNLMRRALVNLLTNAVKYSPSADAVYFDLAFDSPKDWITISVRDDGIGIPQADITHLFDTFFRASNVRHIPGTGLGLAIVKRAVDAHGGTISVQSELGAGTTFTLSLPIRTPGPALQSGLD